MSVYAMLIDLKELARLEAGRETRQSSEFDAAALVIELGNANRRIAVEKNLLLEVNGPSTLLVYSDPSKVRRLIQNLLLNALKYTVHGGVILSVGMDKDNWWFMVKDTGPGILAGPGAPMVIGLTAATASARESDGKAVSSTGGDLTRVGPGRRRPRRTCARTAYQQPGEGLVFRS